MATRSWSRSASARSTGRRQRLRCARWQARSACGGATSPWSPGRRAGTRSWTSTAGRRAVRAPGCPARPPARPGAIIRRANAAYCTDHGISRHRHAGRDRQPGRLPVRDCTSGSELAGFIDYRLRHDHGAEVISLIHTEVEPAFQGAHLATHLARVQPRRRAQPGLERPAVLPVRQLLDQEAPGVHRPGPGRPPREFGLSVSPRTAWRHDVDTGMAPRPAGSVRRPA